MTAPLLVAMPGNEGLAASLAEKLGVEVGHVETRKFPDDETYLRLLANPEGRPVAVVCTLDHPNDKLLSLLFAAATARDLKASSVGLVSPYLAYMRQDRRFKPGEAVTSREVARLLSGAFDWLVTVDPHLHRYDSLGEIYAIPTRVIRAAPLISEWIKKNIANPLIIGPDSESEQWVAAVANDAAAPHSVLEKTRLGDREVVIKTRRYGGVEGPHACSGRRHHLQRIHHARGSPAAVGQGLGCTGLHRRTWVVCGPSRRAARPSGRARGHIEQRSAFDKRNRPDGATRRCNR